MIEVFPPSLHTLPFLRSFGRRAVPAEPRSNGVSPGGAVSRQLTNRALDEPFIQEAGSDNLSLMGESRATHPKRALIIPALNEEESIGRAIAAVPRGLFDEIIVVDNGSLDATAEKASQAGARVLAEPRRGYGRACWTGIQSLAEGIETLVFMDADLSDDPQDAQRLVDALEKGPYDMVVGSRALGKADPGALEPWQRFGNWVATRVIGLLWGVHYTDLGPFRARLSAEHGADFLPEASEGAPGILHRTVAGPEQTSHHAQVSHIGSLKEPLDGEGGCHSDDRITGHRSGCTAPHNREQKQGYRGTLH